MFKLIAAALMALASTMAMPGSHGNITVTADGTGNDEMTSCADIEMYFNHGKAVRDQEELALGNVNALDLVAARNGGIRVHGWNQPRYAVTVCKMAALASTLSDLHVSVNGNKVTASGPDSSDWTIFYLVNVPENATLTVNAANGPVSLHHVNGTVDAHSANGPLSLKDVNGTVHVTATNGPISYSGSSGTVSLAATNGPISVKLDGSRWDGTLEGRTQNGPLSLKLPRNFQSGVTLTAEGRGPISCKAVACGGRRHIMADEDDESPRHLTFGSGAQAISLTTVNGPVSVKETEE